MTNAFSVYTLVNIKFEWHESKRLSNLEKHGVDFVVAHLLWHSPMLIRKDDRKDYGEIRWFGMGLLHSRVMLVIFTKRIPNVIRIISFRKANKREVKYYEQSTQ